MLHSEVDEDGCLVLLDRVTDVWALAGRTQIFGALTNAAASRAETHRGGRARATVDRLARAARSLRRLSAAR